MKRFKNILYVAGFSGIILKAFHHAVGLAERNNAQLTVILAIENIPPYLAQQTPHKLRKARIDELKGALDKLRKWVEGRIKIETKIIESRPFLEVIREVLRFERDLVIKSVDENTGIRGWLFGSTDLHLLRKCPWPVWLIKSNEPTPIQA